MDQASVLLGGNTWWRRPTAEWYTVKISKEALTNIKMGPWGPSEVIIQGSASKPSRMTEVTQESTTEELVPRSFRITREVLEIFYDTKGCPKCEALRRGEEHQTVHHKRECRT